MTLIAFRFFDPQTDPNPPWPAPLPASWISAPWQRFSPAGPMATIAGFCVVRPASPDSRFGASLRSSRATQPVCVPVSMPISFQISSCVAQVSLPQSPAASRMTTESLRMSTHTGLSALPSITMASQPAYFSIVEKRPPKPERVNQSIPS